MAIAVFKDVFHKYSAALAPEQRCHQRRLRIRRKARIRRRAHRSDRAQRSAAFDVHRILPALHAAACLTQRQRHGGQCSVVRAPQHRTAAAGGHCAQIRRAHDAVCNHAVRAAVQRLPSLDRHDRAARAADLRAHGVEEVLQLHDLRLTCGVVDHGRPLRAAGGEDRVLGRSDARQGQYDLTGGELLRLAAQQSAALLDLRAQGAQGG